jgi:hypothetical protein
LEDSSVGTPGCVESGGVIDKRLAEKNVLSSGALTVENVLFGPSEKPSNIAENAFISMI